MEYGQVSARPLATVDRSRCVCRAQLTMTGTCTVGLPWPRARAAAEPSLPQLRSGEGAYIAVPAPDPALLLPRRALALRAQRDRIAPRPRGHLREMLMRSRFDRASLANLTTLQTNFTNPTIHVKPMTTFLERFRNRPLDWADLPTKLDWPGDTSKEEARGRRRKVRTTTRSFGCVATSSDAVAAGAFGVRAGRGLPDACGCGPTAHQRRISSILDGPDARQEASVRSPAQARTDA